MVSKIESESLYGSSIYREGNFTDESDLPDYARLCRRVFPDMLHAENDNVIEPEAEENIARYLKYLTRLPLASLKMEPTLLQSDLQRISKELTTLLLNEAVNPAKHSETDIFEVIYNMDKLAVTSANSISTMLDKTQDALTRLEAACTQFTTDMSELEQRTQMIQRVLDKQDLITRFVELPRVMQMCVAGGYYQEAVDIAEHVRVTGDRLVQDLRDGAHVLPGSMHELALSPTSREQLLGFISDIQKQVHAEFENMVLDLCRELSYTNSAKPTAVVQLYGNATDSLSRTDSRRSSDASFSPGSTTKRRGSAANGGSRYEKAMKRLSQVAKIISILRHIGMFTEAELQMLFLRSRWQAWSQTAESLNGFIPLACMDMLGEMDLASEGILKTASTMTCVPTSLFSTEQETERSHNSAEIAAYLAKYLDAFFSWLAEVETQYRTLFSVKTVLEKPDLAYNPASEPDPFIDLATFASQQLLSVVLPMFGLLDEAPGIRSMSSSVDGIKNVCVVGAGQMGIGIGLVAARVAKLNVQFIDSSPAQLSKGLEFLDKLLLKDIAKGKYTEEVRSEVKARITTASSISQMATADFVIEAISENTELKRKVFGQLSATLPQETILATNTSSISITKIASAATRPENVIGMHFMNPVPVMKLVEVIPGLQTSKQTLETTLALAQKMGKTTTMSQDVPGFIANRLLMPYINEAIIALGEGIATKEDIDTTMKLGTNNPMGPLTLADFIGLDTCLAIMKVLHNELGDSKYRPAVLLQKYVDAGWLGVKSGRGIYEYPSKK
ncbi:hypothetical protein IWW36_002059 [Coemansia brasiliensis]|uniref:Component of oligomeric Golgi complex 8 n=1 Tax=Coemansia brasiliensis TaxID=2650707 RepID=A0A9W8I7W3_9FUNG|nr:hypothetical protein IWW36_002059 [Coemansia brasiliensis]